MENNINRALLGFQDLVLKHFSFLESDYGYKCALSTLYLIRYVSDKIYINIYHERVSYEIYFVIGFLERESSEPLKVNLANIVNFFDLENRFKFYQASKKDSVHFVISRIAEIARLHCKELFNGNIDMYKKILNAELG